jgi:tetratricopeptide (TPR) repeat protein
MHKSVVTLLVLSSIIAPASGQQKAAEPPRQATRTAPGDTGFISPAEVNIRIEPDERMLVVMAALNIAGFDTEPTGETLSPARVALRKDIVKLSPEVKAQLAAFYKANRREGVDEASDAMRYAMLSFMMTQPPGFTVNAETVPPDLKPLAEFSKLVSNFYISSGMKELVPKYMAVNHSYAAAYRRPVGELIHSVLDYFHTRPETVVTMKPLVVEAEGPNKQSKDKTKLVARNRTRQVYIVPESLAPIDTAAVRADILNQKDDQLARRVGDDYLVVVGPSRRINLTAVRQALIRFVLDPVIERHLKAALEYKDPITKLVSGVPTAGREFKGSVYLVLRESLAQAAEARMRRIEATESGSSYGEQDAVFDLAQAYLRGAVLAFHFYDALKGYEQVGVDIDSVIDQLVASAKFEREQQRPAEFEATIAQVSAARRARASRSAASESLSPTAGRILKSDDLIRERRFVEARPLLEEVLKSEPGNPRALFGMAQVVSNSPSPVELDPKADEDDKIQAQYDRLESAVKLYRKAIEHASRENEAWLVQWSHVYVGRILDFQEFRADAIAEYERAIALGEIANGAYKEAVEGKQRPYVKR